MDRAGNSTSDDSSVRAKKTENQRDDMNIWLKMGTVNYIFSERRDQQLSENI